MVAVQPWKNGKKQLYLPWKKWQIYVKELNIELRANIHDDVFTAQQRRTQIL